MVKDVLMAGFVCYLTVSLMGCTYKQKPLPARPEQVRGWKDKAFDGVDSLAELVLDQGKSSENGQLGVEVVSISPNILGNPSQLKSIASTASAAIRRTPESDERRFPIRLCCGDPRSV